MLAPFLDIYTLFLVITACALSLAAVSDSSGGDKPDHAGKGYRNIEKDGDRSFLDFLRWRWEQLWKDIPGPEEYDFPLAENDPAFLKANREKTTLTWIGHATALVQMEGKNILTDPQFSERASPLQWAGPRRVVPPGLRMEDLPDVDIVVISHSHYDSLDEESVKRLHAREGGRETVFFVPLGLKDWFEDLGITQVVELGWWESCEVNGLVVTAVPVRHWSKRSLLSENDTLWAGWAVRGKRKSFFFAGDSGYSPVFKEIGRRLGPFSLAAIPIGAYEPRWFMKEHHLDPEEAVQVHKDIRSRKSVAIHWGTFALTDEPLDEPPERLERAKRDMGVPDDEFLVLKHGETILLK